MGALKDTTGHILCSLECETARTGSTGNTAMTAMTVRIVKIVRIRRIRKSGSQEVQGVQEDCEEYFERTHAKKNILDRLIGNAKYFKPPDLRCRRFCMGWLSVAIAKLQSATRMNATTKEQESH